MTSNKVTMGDVEGDEEAFYWLNKTDAEKRESIYAQLKQIDARLKEVEYFLDEYLLAQ
jgi:hypothetical protein